MSYLSAQFFEMKQPKRMNGVSLLNSRGCTSEDIYCITELKEDLLGKTTTSESVENIDLDLQDGTNIYTHVWFGSIAFESKKDKNKTVLLLKDDFGKPELIVVVYLRYGGYGKEAAPLAAQMVKKWREIKQNMQKIKKILFFAING